MFYYVFKRLKEKIKGEVLIVVLEMLGVFNDKGYKEKVIWRDRGIILGGGN